MRNTLADTMAIDRECEKLTEEMDTVSILIQKLIAENAAKAMDQDEYNSKYDALARRYNAAQERCDKLQGRKATIGFEVDVLECFMFEISALPDLPVEFSDHLWNSMIDHVTVYHDDRVAFSFKNGREIIKTL